MKSRTGSWRCSPQKLRKVPESEQCTIVGHLSSEDPVEAYFLDLSAGVNGGREGAVEVGVGNCMAGGGGGLLLGSPSLRGGCWVLVLSLTRMRWMTGRS